MSGRLIEEGEGIRALLAATHRIAVLGIKTKEQSDQPAYYVPAYLVQAGFELIPVPVYYPDITEILGAKVYRKLSEIPGEIDLLDVFRRPQDLPAHLDEILAAQPKAVWLQLGIRDDAFARRLIEAGIDVVQDRCLMVDHRRYGQRL